MDCQRLLSLTAVSGLLCGGLALVPLTCSAQSASAQLDPKILAKVNELANVQKNLSTLSTPGTELHAKEVARAETPSGSVVRYEFFATNLPHDRQYILGTLRINQELQMDPDPKILDPSGKVMDGPDDPLDLFVMAAKGEPYRFQLTSKDGKYKTFVSVVPFPIAGSDQGCSVEAILLLPDAEAVLLQGKGFSPESTIHINIDSGDEKHSGNQNADKEGKWSSLLLPYRNGAQKGETKVTTSSPTCHPELNITWGKGTYHLE